MLSRVRGETENSQALRGLPARRCSSPPRHRSARARRSSTLDNFTSCSRRYVIELRPLRFRPVCSAGFPEAVLQQRAAAAVHEVPGFAAQRGSSDSNKKSRVIFGVDEGVPDYCCGGLQLHHLIGQSRRSIRLAGSLPALQRTKFKVPRKKNGQIAFGPGCHAPALALPIEHTRTASSNTPRYRPSFLCRTAS